MQSHKVAIVGGRQDVFDRFEENLMDWGIEVAQTQEYLPLRVASAVTAVIVIKTICSHKLFHAAQLQTKKRGLLLVAVEHNWTQAEPLLLAHGLLESPTPPEHAPHSGDNGAAFSMIAQTNAEIDDLRQRLDQAETMVLEKDEQFRAQTERLDELYDAVEHMGNMLAKQAVQYPNIAQRAVAAVALLPQEKEAARRRMVSGIRCDVSGEANERVGNRVGVSRTTVRQAVLIARDNPELFEAMRRGEIRSMSEAWRRYKQNQ